MNKLEEDATERDERSCRLESGVVVQWLTEVQPRALRVEINHGVDHESSEQAGGRRFVARADWRDLSPIEQGRLFATTPTSIAGAVSVFQVDPSVSEVFRKQRADALFAADTPAAAHQEILWECAADVLSATETAGILPESLRSCGLQVTPAGSRSTAFDHRKGGYIGLHIDNHDKHSLADRPAAFQLMCLNLGRAERHFMFANLAAGDLATRTGLSSSEAEVRYQQAWQLTADFFSLRPDYPILRLTLPPNHGYIAITQNLIHDGASGSQRETDIALLLAGRFNIDRAKLQLPSAIPTATTSAMN